MSEIVSLWDSEPGLGAPAFISIPAPFHPLTILVRALATSDLQPAVLRWAAALLAAVAAYVLFRELTRSRIPAIAAVILVFASFIFIPPGFELLVLGVISSAAALAVFLVQPGRGRWAVLTAVLWIAILGDSWSALPVVLFPVGIVVAAILLARGRSDWAGGVTGALVAAVLSALLSAFWWIPARVAADERGSVRTICGDGWSCSKRLQAFERLETNPVWKEFASPPVRRFHFVPEFLVEPGEQHAVERLLPVRAYNTFATVDHVPGKIRRLAGSALNAESTRTFTARGGTAGLLEFRNSEARFQVESDGWNLLVTNIPWWFGWRAYWNGERLPPVVVNVAFLGTFIPPGEGELRLRYRPREFDTGLRIAGFGLIGFLATLIWPWFLTIPTPRFARVVLDTSVVRRFIADPARRGRIAIARSLATLPWKWIGRMTAILFLLGYAILLVVRRVDVAGGADTSGYLNQARMWSRGELIVPIGVVRELQLPQKFAGAFTPLGFAPGPEPGTMVPTYPPGVPMHLALLRLIGGDDAMFLFAAIISILTLLLMYRLGRELGLSEGWAIAGVVVLALCPLFLFNALFPVSDVAAVGWSILPVMAALRSRESWRWGLLAGAAAGVGVLVRPSQIFLLPALALIAGLRPRALLAMAAGGLPFAIVQMAIAANFYGSPFRTGYGDPAALLAWSNFPPRAIHYGYWLGALLSPLVFPLGLGGLFIRSIDRFTRAALGIWFFLFFFFYCFYAPFGEWGSARFLLPAFPALILLLLIGAQILFARLGKGRIISAVILLAVVVASQLALSQRLDVIGAAKGQRVYRDASVATARLVSGRPIIMGTELSGAYYFYVGETLVRWDSLTPEDFERLREVTTARGRRWYALLSEYEMVEARRRARGDWVPLARFGDVTLYELR